MQLTFQQLRDANARRGIEWMGSPADPRDLLFTSVELAGEVGEACNIVKKLERHRAGVAGGISGPDAHHALAEELADVVICADRVAECLGIDLGAMIVDKFNKTSKKHGLSVRLDAPSSDGRPVKNDEVDALVSKLKGTANDLIPTMLDLGMGEVNVGCAKSAVDRVLERDHQGIWRVRQHGCGCCDPTSV